MALSEMSAWISNATTQTNEGASSSAVCDGLQIQATLEDIQAKKCSPTLIGSSATAGSTVGAAVGASVAVVGAVVPADGAAVDPPAAASDSAEDVKSKTVGT